jgi:hypothetical protein
VQCSFTGDHRRDSLDSEGSDIAHIADAIVQSTPRVMVLSVPQCSTSRVCGPVVDFGPYCTTLFHSSEKEIERWRRNR